MRRSAGAADRTLDPTGGGFYSDAALYHLLHEGDTAREVLALERIAKRHVGRGVLRWLEPACGTGRHLVELAARGHSGVGIDISRPMLEHARMLARSGASRREKAGRGARERNARRLRFVDAPMEAFDVGAGRFDVAFVLVNSIRHLMSDALMFDHLRCVARALRPGGVYVVGIECVVAGWDQASEDVWHARGRLTGAKAAGPVVRATQLVSYVPEPRRRVERVLSQVTLRSGRGALTTERFSEASYELRTYTLAQWRRLLARAGWEVVEVCRSTGGVRAARAHGYALYVLRPVKR